MKNEYNKLDQLVKDGFTEEMQKESVRYNKKVFTILVVRTIALTIPFEYFMLFEGGIAMLWEEIANSAIGAAFLCQHFRRENTEMILGLLCCIAYKLADNVLHMPSAVAMTCLDRSYKLSEAGPIEFLISRIMMLVEYVLIVVPVTAFVIKVIEYSGDYLLVSFFFGTFAVELVIMYVYPRLIQPLTAKYEPLSKNNTALHGQIVDICDQVGFNKN